VAKLAFDRVVTLRFDFAWRSEERIEMLRRLENDKLTSEIEKRCFVCPFNSVQSVLNV